MILRLSIHLIIVLLFVEAQGQNMPRLRLTTVPSQIIFLEFPITLEHSVGRNTIGIMAAYRPALKEGGMIEGYGEYHLQNYWNFAYSGATAGLLHKYYLRDRFGLHLETSVLYRRWWFDRKQISYSDDDQFFNELRSEEQEVLILKVVIGKSIMWQRERGPAFILEYFAGPSVRWKRLDLRTHEGSIDGMSVIGSVQEDEIWSPGFQFAIRVGIGVK